METGFRSRVRVGALEFDLEAGELRGGDRKVVLQEQPFQILLMLVERSGSLVTRAEIQKRLWPNDTVVEFDHSIHTAINKLRQALGDSAERPKYIETVARRGYRLMVTVTRSVSSPASPKLEDSSRFSSAGNGTGHISAALLENGVIVATDVSTRSAPKLHGAFALCAALLAAGYIAYHFGSTTRPPSQLANITQVSQWNKPMNDAKLSPDGHTVAFVSRIGGIAQVFLMLTSGGEPLQLTNDEGDKVLGTFSHDGKEIYYERSLGRDEAWAVPSLGGAPRRVVSATHVVPSLDGASVFYVKLESLAVFRASKSGLNEELVYNFKGAGQSFFPVLAFPSGNDLLAAAVRTHSPNFRLYSINLTSHEAVDLGELSGNPFDVVWAEPGISVLFSRTVNGLTNIWNYLLKDRSLTQITFGTGPDYSPMPDPEGKGIYYVNGKSSGFLTAYHVHSKESTEIASDEATEPSISLDGKHVMYITFPAPQRSELWVSDIDGGNPAKLAIGKSLETGTWAPDNFHLTFQESRGGAGDEVYIVGVDGSGLRHFPGTGDIVWNLVWSPDQKSIYVTSSEKTGSMPTVWKWSLDGSNPERLVDNCGGVFDAGPAGKYLLAGVISGEKTGIYEVSVFERKCIALLPGVATFSATFAQDGRSFLYAVASRGEVTMYRQRWRDGKLIGAPQVALKVPFAFPLGYATGNAYDFSRDLSTIVYARPGGHADLFLLSQK
jgi:DNA-binding winged helix-turn-helix (wHTH) protein/Tol biopolymer transport system component